MANSSPGSARLSITPPQLGETDAVFAVLRALTLLGGIGWILFNPFPLEAKRTLSLVFGAFLAYSLVLYAFIFRYPGSVRSFYLIALVLDLAFVFHLIRNTGGAASNFHWAFYLLVALHSYYYGIAMGIAVAAASFVLYVASDPSHLLSLHWTDNALRLSFFLLIAAALGLLSEKERRDRRRIEKLNLELERNTRNLEQAYRNLTETHKKLMQSEKLASIGTLAAGVAHEINNPLDGVQNCISMLLEETSPGEERHSYLIMAREGLSRIERTVRSLLDFARERDLELGAIDINSVVEKALELAKYKILGRKIQVKKLVSQECMVNGDPRHLGQVFLNIVLNAVDAMPGGGTITVETAIAEPGSDVLRDAEIPPADTRYVTVRITDAGTGISQENLRRIFDPFFTTKGVGEGTGLGLSVSLGIVRKHGGQILVSTEEGKGSTFTVLLPCRMTS